MKTFVSIMARKKRDPEYKEQFFSVEDIDSVSCGVEYRKDYDDETVKSVIHLKQGTGRLSTETPQQIFDKLNKVAPGMFFRFTAVSKSEKTGEAIAPKSDIQLVQTSQGEEDAYLGRPVTLIEHNDGYYRAVEPIEEIMAQLNENLY